MNFKDQISPIFIKIDDFITRLVPILREKWNLINWKILSLFLIAQLIVVALVFIIFGLIPIKSEVKHIYSQIGFNDSIIEKKLANFESNKLNELQKAKNLEQYLGERLMLSKGDSISLIINIPDSLAIISVKGVNLLEVKIKYIHLNKGLKKLPNDFLNRFLRGPMFSIKDLSTIEKHPIVVKKAPKDTLEYQSTTSAPQLPKYTDVFFLLEFETNLTIEVKQLEKDIVGHRNVLRNYWFQKKKMEMKNHFRYFISESSGYTYKIVIEIPREDARSIYRALPDKPQVLVRYN